MAGRGCTITVTVLGGSGSHTENQNISLPVALHSPLEVLKDQLEDITQIQPGDQVLILLDPSDPDGNSDVMLTGREYMSLRQCGIQNGSTLTLHALGMSAERQQKRAGGVDCKNEGANSLSNTQESEHILSTRVTAAQADHSYNGVIFDISCDGPFEVEIKSMSVAGMLGRVRVFGRNCAWEDDEEETDRRGLDFSRSWAHQGNVSRTGWVLLADKVCQPSWDNPTEIPFDMRSFRLQPHSTRALYVHSNLPDDLGIQYNSHRRTDIVARDDHITVSPGVGHTGSVPFDERHGWYRSYRGPCGSFKYTVRWKGWTKNDHRNFPAPLQRAVLSMLMCRRSNEFALHEEVPVTNTGAGAGAPAANMVDDSSNCSGGDSEDGSSSSRLNRKAKRALSPKSNSRQEQEESATHFKMGAISGSGAGPLLSADKRQGSGDALKKCENNPPPLRVAAPEDMRRMWSLSADSMVCSNKNSAACGIANSESCRLNLVSAGVSFGNSIRSLPLPLVYHILEYMHWDWFEELNVAEESDSDDDGGVRSSQQHSSGRSGRGNFGSRLAAATGSASQMLWQQLLSGWGMAPDADVAAAAVGDDDDDDNDEEEEEGGEGGGGGGRARGRGRGTGTGLPDFGGMDPNMIMYLLNQAVAQQYHGGEYDDEDDDEDDDNEEEDNDDDDDEEEEDEEGDDDDDDDDDEEEDENDDDDIDDGGDDNSDADDDDNVQ